MGKTSTQKITTRILSQLGNDELIENLLKLPKSDLNSLLLKIFQIQSINISPADLVKTFQLNRFSVPSKLDPLAYHSFEVDLLSLAKKNDINPILLSPSAPFASCSSFGYVDQNNIVSALRGTEILSDPTNMLSIIIAKQLKKNEVDNKIPLHYCTTARVLRSQTLPPIEGFYSHFGLFSIVSSGKDTGSYTCEKILLKKHLIYYKMLLMDKENKELSIVLGKRSGYTDNDGFFSEITELIKKELPDVPLSFDFEQEKNNYYKGINFKMYIKKGNDKIEIGDGGFVDWIQKMLNSKKERCLISGISIDRLII